MLVYRTGGLKAGPPCQPGATMSARTIVPPQVPIRVLLIDPDDVERSGLRALLSNDPRFAIVGETPFDGVPHAQRLHPDLIVFDPATDGSLDLVLTSALAKAAPASHLCVRTTRADPQTVIEMVLAGVDGYLQKHRRGSEELRHNLFSIGRFGALTIDRAIVLDARERLGGKIKIALPNPGTPELTARQQEVLRHIAGGDTDDEIASHLHVTHATIRTHVETMKGKLGARNRPNLVRLACERGFLD